MTNEDVGFASGDVESQLDEIYEKIGTRPDIFSGRVECIEAFVLGLEAALYLVDGGKRKGAYRNFRSDEQFGCEYFRASFERINQCRCGFVPRSNVEMTSEMNDHEAIFRREFEKRWGEFLTWRKEQRAMEDQGDG